MAGPVDALNAPDSVGLRKRLGIPADKEPLLILLVGYSASAADAVSKASWRDSGNFSILK